MELRQLEYFLEIARSGSVTGAANALHMAQPSVSQSIRLLERELQSPLFERIGRGMRLTPAGESLLGPARRMLREREDAHAAVAAVRGLHGGQITIAALPSLAVDPLARAIGEFRAAYPLVNFAISKSIHPEEVSLLVKHGECEIGLTTVNEASDYLTTHEINLQRLVLVVPIGYPPLPDPVTSVELAELPFVCGPPGGSSRSVLEQFMTAERRELNIAVETESTDAIVPLVVNGAGVALIPSGLARPTENSTKSYEIRPTVSRRTFLIHRKRIVSPAAAAFVKMELDGLAPGDPDSRSVAATARP